MLGRNPSAPVALSLGLALSLAACRSEPVAEAPSDPADTIEEAPGPPPPDADIEASLGELGAEPGLPDRPRFVGRWAAEESMCDAQAWRFTTTELRTPAGSVCRFTDVREVPGGYDIAARCTAEAPERDDRLRLRFAESARAMLFESETVADAGLVRCEPP